MDDSWEERMAQRARARADERRGIAKTPTSPMPPLPDGECPECDEWLWDTHYGWLLFQTCNNANDWIGDEARCDHAHHDDEMWLAAPS